MRILLFVLAFSAQAFALQDGPSLRGRDLLKQVLPEFKDIDEVADLIADNKWKKEERIAQEQDAAYDEEMAKTIGEVKKLNPRPLPNSAQKSITEINSALGLDEVLVEGDILMTADEARRYFEVQERRSKRQAYQRWDFPKSLWSNGVYYTYDPAMNQQGIDAVEDAIAFWQKHTCVRFHRVQNGASVPVDPLLIFYPGWGCFSAMGRNHYAKEQKVSIGSGCEYVSVATHEIAHALGFMHEQSRWDRDNYLWIDLNNVIPNKTHNYDNYNKNENDNYGKQYDFSGIMHYEDNSFAINSSVPAMYARNSAYQMSIGGAQIPAYGDIYEMNMLYSCYDKCANSGTICQNEGRPNPNNCAVCQCPSGFGGRDCSEREAPSAGLTCGETLQASDSWQQLSSKGVVGSGVYQMGNISDPAHCTWHIKAPAGKRLQYYVTEVGVDYNPDVLCTRVCYFGGLSIKGLEKTWIPQGMRFCCKDQFNRVMITASNILVVQPWNNFRYTDFSIMYKIDGTAQPPTTKKTTTTTTTKSTLKPTTTTRPVTTSEPGQVFGYNDYIFSTFKKTFQDAEDFCKSYNAHLISLHDKATEDDIEALFSRIGRNKNQAYWIGLHKPQGINSRFSWVDGSYLNYTNWMNGLPGATPSEECGAHQYSQWVGVSCQSKNPFVCERY
ncbi:hypothetical protein QR680_016084 [Steinernema hermaphroditum]|uniref:Zinc metalloproteinase n=1 Tax=Steinernema hermaphroditum TaxID=289476 RepID=A0AA39HA07_9BILA|nr:hypothetical protein QR680_016084 [Steinernema hermaphroditum]